MKKYKLYMLAVLLLGFVAAVTALAIEDIAIPADLYDGSARKVQVDAIDVRLKAVERVPTVAEKTQTVTLRGDASIAVKDGAGAALTEAALVRVWFSTTDNGAPVATDNTVAVATGTAVQAVTANAHYLVLTGATGLAEVRVTVAGAGDRYVMVEYGGRVTSAKLEIAVIE